MSFLDKMFVDPKYQTNDPRNPELARCMTEAKRRLTADSRGAWGECEIFPDW